MNFIIFFLIKKKREERPFYELISKLNYLFDNIFLDDIKNVEQRTYLDTFIINIKKYLNDLLHIYSPLTKQGPPLNFSILQQKEMEFNVLKQNVLSFTSDEITKYSKTDKQAELLKEQKVKDINLFKTNMIKAIDDYYITPNILEFYKILFSSIPINQVKPIYNFFVVSHGGFIKQISKLCTPVTPVTHTDNTQVFKHTFIYNNDVIKHNFESIYHYPNLPHIRVDYQNFEIYNGNNCGKPPLSAGLYPIGGLEQVINTVPYGSIYYKDYYTSDVQRTVKNISDYTDDSKFKTNIIFGGNKKYLKKYLKYKQKYLNLQNI